MARKRVEVVRPEIVRSFPLDDIEIQRSGDGRTVTAYAAMFGSPYEVRDVHGHYYEEITRTAFDRTLSHGIAGRVQCLFNHGMTIQHTPSERYSMPLGTPLEIKPDGRGLLTVTRYAKTDTADEVLELIRSGAITAQSFQGPIYHYRRSGIHGDSGLPIVQRTELGLRDYGPATFAVSVDARILAVRSVTELVDEIGSLTDDERAELIASLSESSAGTPPEAGPPATGTQEPPGPPTPSVVSEPPAPEAPAEVDELELLEIIQAQRRRRAA